MSTHSITHSTVHSLKCLLTPSLNQPCLLTPLLTQLSTHSNVYSTPSLNQPSTHSITQSNVHLLTPLLTQLSTHSNVYSLHHSTQPSTHSIHSTVHSPITHSTVHSLIHSAQLSTHSITPLNHLLTPSLTQLSTHLTNHSINQLLTPSLTQPFTHSTIVSLSAATMEFDEVLEHIGDIGVYQVTLFLMLGAFEFMTADVVAMNFIGGYQDHWCRVCR